MLVKGRGEVAAASCDCNTKLRKVKECFVRLVVSKHGLLSGSHPAVAAMAGFGDCCPAPS